MSRGVISLLFKKGDRSEVRNWRPISLLNVGYKLLAKTLANHLAKFLLNLVQRDQGAFVQGRSIFENILTAIEALELVDREEANVAVLLLDLEKAYDRVNWPFVLTTLKVVGFGDQFCSWVKALYCFSTAAVCVNGQFSEEFCLTQSLRQGCPLAPLLFVLHLEPLLCNIRCHPEITGLMLHNGRESRVKALADDLFAILQNSYRSLDALKSCLVKFGELSEAAVNWNKSVFFLPRRFSLSVQWGMERVPEEAAERFLGVQVALGDCSSSQDLILQERVTKRVRSWGRGRHLSIIGRALVVMVSAFALLWYVAAVRRIAPSTLKTVRGVARRFIWKPDSKEDTGFISKVACDSICLPREEGGLALIDPALQNSALLGKWLVRVATGDQEADWLLLAEILLAKDWELVRPRDVWVAIMTDTFCRRRPNSRFWRDVLLAWKKVTPNLLRPPKTKEEVKRWPLFENQWITDDDGQWFSLEKKPGNFALSWLRKGVSTVGDLWDSLTNQWKSPQELKVVLGQLPEQETRATLLRSAIPGEWKEILGPSGVDKPGTW
ncbi:hypothetical protein CBR_g167 [Chara braunii]|uniref:Reverse transcriptase domain-containing protein n=1 Tax=Chara braunii TaxID=69332 RepID=A0A388JLT7_CHABU|nr:hypothetical protein CBR_g167 [Chara braunii]|eukprot:GBG58767.1 hypothetical protein CBR_g167 [Chara braunii]